MSAPPAAAANAFANDGNFMAQFLAQQQISVASSSSTTSKPTEEAVVTAAERDAHVKESVAKNDGSFMATFLALQHKEEQLAKQQRNDAYAKLLSASSADPSAAAAPKVASPSSVATPAGAPSEPPKKKRSRWDAGSVEDTAAVPVSQGKRKAVRSSQADKEANALALLVESASDGSNALDDALVRAKQQKHVAELRFLEQRIRGFQQQMQLSNASGAQRKAQSTEQLAEERRAEYERLAVLLEEQKTYKDSVEDAELGTIQDGTLEHRRRAREMLETLQSADTLTQRGEGKHHLGDFLPQAELNKFMREAKRAMTGGNGLLQSEQAASSRDTVTAAAGTRGLGHDGSASQLQEDDDEFDQYRKRMMLAYRFRPNPLNNPRRPYS